MRAATLPSLILVLVLAAAGALGAGYAFGASETISASAACCTFSKPTFTMDQGEVATFQNLGTASHNVSASGNGPDGAPLFSSATIGTGQAPVQGTQYLASGSYHFICTVHPDSMTADLVVTGAGTPVPRPAVSMKVLSSDLDKVVSSRKLKLKLIAAAASNDVSLIARKGAKKLGSKQNVDLAAGVSRTVRLPLTGAGRRALDDLASAKVKVSAAVPFGSPATAKRRLH